MLGTFGKIDFSIFWLLTGQLIPRLKIERFVWENLSIRAGASMCSSKIGRWSRLGFFGSALAHFLENQHVFVSNSSCRDRILKVLGDSESPWSVGVENAKEHSNWRSIHEVMIMNAVWCICYSKNTNLVSVWGGPLSEVRILSETFGPKHFTLLRIKRGTN